MRFILLIVGCVALGAMSAGAIQAVYPQATETFAAVQGLRANWSDFRLSDLTPIGLVYRYVITRVTSGEPRVALHQEPLPSFKPIDLNNLNAGNKFDQRDLQKYIDAGFNRQVQETTRHMQDMSAWMRSPPAFRGPPPH